MRKVKYVILGAGTSGLTALSAIKKETEDFVLIEGGAFGTTCARVGCMPSKALIHSANLIHQVSKGAEFGLQNVAQVDIDSEAVLRRVRQLRDRFTGGIQSGTTDLLSESQLIKGFAEFTGPNQVAVNGETVEFERIIIATGSRPVVPAPWKALGSKLLTSDEIFELETLPKRVAVIGLGIIGLEIGQALARLGVEVTGFEMQETIGGLSEPTVTAEAIALISQEFPVYLGAAAELKNTDQGVLVTLDKSEGKVEVEVDVVLGSLGRRPNLDRLNLAAAGVKLDERGMPSFNVNTLQIENKPIFIAGDVNGYRPILHEAGYEGKMAVMNAMSYPTVTAYQRKTPLGVAFCDPEIGFFGRAYRDLDKEAAEVVSFNIHRNNGRAIVMGEDHGVISLYADKVTKRLIGGEMVLPHAEHFTHLLAWAVENEMTVIELVKMPFYHPVLEEAIQSAIQMLFKALYPVESKCFDAELTVMQ
ncbi:MAG: dihydrolipoyl dehydrogenase [Gammaproteobacteria bacterium]|nr:dihydrolipoyl dehydrogenase [Gammaproteobacteria bacterium]